MGLRLCNYISAFAKARLEAVLPYLTDRCPDCSQSIYDNDHSDSFIADHTFFGMHVIVGCKGRWVVNPNALGIDDEEWEDWRSPVVSTFKGVRWAPATDDDGFPISSGGSGYAIRD